MGLFKKKEKIATREVGRSLLKHMRKFVSDSVDELLKKEEFQNIDKDKLFSELMMLSFWNLQFLKCPNEVWGFALFGYFESIEIPKNSKPNSVDLIYLMENRSKEYFSAWEKGIWIFIFTLGNNIHDKVAPDFFGGIYLANFLSALTEANKNALLTIKNRVEIIPFQSGNSQLFKH